MSRIPKSNFGFTPKPVNLVSSTPLEPKKLSSNARAPTSKFKFSDSAEMSVIHKTSDSSACSASKSQFLRNTENQPLKRAASSLQHLPKKQPKLATAPKSNTAAAKGPANDFKTKYNEVQEKFSILQNEHSDAVEKYDNCIKELEAARSTLASLEHENIRILNELKTSQSVKERLASEMSDVMNQRDGFVSDVETLKISLDKQKLEFDRVSSDLRETKNNLFIKTKEYDSLKVLLDNEIRKSLELSMKLQENSINLTSLAGDIAFLTSSKNILEQKNKESSALIADLKLECDKLKDKIGSIENANKNLEADLENKIKEYNNIYSMHNLESIKNKDLESVLSSCQIKIATFTSDLVDSKNYSELLRMKNEEQERKIKDLIEKNEEMQRTTESMHENQKLLRNQIHDLKGHIRVYCRVRPMLDGENNKCTVNMDIVDACTMNLEKISADSTNGLSKKQNFKHSFSFDGVFPPHTPQIEIFQEVSSLVQSALDGYNVCIFAYGQTGSGKTYTMEGDHQQNNIGIIPRTVEMIFSNIPNLSRLGWQFEISAAFLEIYNENIYDLLDSNREQDDHSIKMSDGKRNEVYVSNLKEEVVTSASELLRLLSISQKNRQTAMTLCNERSSRSHSITKIKINAYHAVRKEKLSSCINLVDLAGSESGKTTQRMEETKSINKSLSELSKVILAIQSKQSHVPFRNSKLTYLLMPCLSGNSKTLMLVNVSQFDDCYLETVNSLRFASQVSTCKTGVTKKNVTTVK